MMNQQVNHGLGWATITGLALGLFATKATAAPGLSISSLNHDDFDADPFFQPAADT
ncbi:hypothetical protein BJ085DRAFT_38432 [Dimargaris cristalligena]|uniref:Uncharacterized protein n=1 Tax=Dimargaris cristalligena TaxID=215637 RepID=A0A4P9ZLZ0_9FUNG|nr:hypothetical protein BJ085DRAFT_38432 [Dimargaris cristalligena]|eukprot:RKP34326.1 hypothetical protein BJ085DRAFT_38432 [Dimargaris cristalligena]